MKNQQNNSSSCGFRQSQGQAIKKLNMKKSNHPHTLKCTKDSLAIQFCYKNACSQTPPFICKNWQCQCRFHHFQCLKGQLQYIFKSIEGKLKCYQTMKQQIQKMFDKMIDCISLARDKILEEIQENMNNANLNEIEKQFLRYSSLDSKEKDNSIVNDFNKNKLMDLWQSIHRKSDNKSMMEMNILQNIKKFNQTKITQTREFQQQILSSIKNCIFNQALSQKQSLYLNIKQSSIIQTQLQIQHLIQFYRNDKVKNFKLLFKASEHDFKLKKYYQIAGKRPNTLLIGLTDKNKKIGAFTPLVRYNQQLSGYRVRDQSGKSFVFSLSQNDILQLVMQEQEYAFIRQPSSHNRIWFGHCGQFVIYDDANSTDQNQTEFNDHGSYQNQKYNDNIQSYLKFNGNQTKNFVFKQWQAWEVQFQT